MFKNSESNVLVVGGWDLFVLMRLFFPDSLSVP